MIKLQLTICMNCGCLMGCTGGAQNIFLRAPTSRECVDVDVSAVRAAVAEMAIFGRRP